MFKKINEWFEFYPPRCETSEGWDAFDKRFKEQAPIRYAINQCKDFIEWKIIQSIKKVIWWFKYRTTQRYHIVNTQLPPGYHEVDDRMLHSIFVLLKNFVEIQCAHKYRWLYPRRGKVFDNKKCGQEYLKSMQRDDENMHLRRPYQAILQAYIYWTIERPKLLKTISELYNAWDMKNRDAFNEINEKENLCDKLDTIHLYKIIKFRQYLWT